MRALLCSGNAAKLREMRELLPALELELLAVDYPPEDGATYLDNARIKARHGREVGPGRLLDARRRLRDRGGRSRRRAGGGNRTLGARPPRGAPARGTRRPARPAGTLRLRARARLSARRRGARDRRARGRDRRGTGAAARASASTRCSSPVARRERWPSSATAGRRTTPTVRSRRRRSRRRSLRSSPGLHHQLTSAPSTITFAIT